MKANKVIAIVGPTASGKTLLSVALAQKYCGEIVAVDSRTVYRGMDIATAKPTSAETRRVPHYLLDIADPTEVVSVSEFQKLAYEAIDQIFFRGKVPFLVGGSGLYMDAIVYGYIIPQEGDSALRLQLEKESTEELLERLKKADEETYQKIDKNNRRRIIRAVEVCILTKKPFSELKKKKKPPFETLWIGLNFPMEKLEARIEKRINDMVQQGLVEEVRRLIDKYPQELPSMSSLGYKEIGEYLRGQKSLKEAIEELKKNTKDYAKRQMTWFKRNEDIHWVNSVEEADRLIASYLG